MPPAKAKFHILYSESQVSCGTAEIILANVDPSPRETRSAGSAQQVSVPREENNDRKTKSFGLFCATLIVYLLMLSTVYPASIRIC